MKFFLYIILIAYFAIGGLQSTAYSQKREQLITHWRGDKKTYSFTENGDWTDHKLSFAVKAGRAITDDRLIWKRNTLAGGDSSQIYASYSSTSGKTTFAITILQVDAEDLPGTDYVWDLEATDTSDTTDVTTLFDGVFRIKPDTQTRFDGVNIPPAGTRFHWAPLDSSSHEPGFLINRNSTNLAEWISKDSTKKLLNVDDLENKTSHIVNVKEFGAVGDGVTEDSLAFQNALQYLFNAGGGTLYIPEGIYSISAKIILPYSGTGLDGAYLAKSITIKGDGNFANSTSGNLATPTYGSVLKMQYTGADDDLILALGAGTLKLFGLSIWGNVPNKNILKIIATTTSIKECTFIGYAAGISASNDAIVFGGSYPHETYGAYAITDSSGFQGYGTVVKDNYFYKIRRAGFFQTYANNIQFVDNTIWNTCGATDSIACIELNGSSTINGNYIAGNLIEATNYPYVFKLKNAYYNTLVGNGLFDYNSNPNFIAAYRLESNSDANYIVSAMHNGLRPLFSTTNNSNYLINTQSAGGSVVPYNRTLEVIGSLDIKSNLYGLSWGAYGAPTIKRFYITPYLTTNSRFDINYIDSTTGTPRSLMRLQDYAGGGTVDWYTSESTLKIYPSGNGNLRLWAGATGTVWIGQQGQIYVGNGLLNMGTTYQSFGNGSNPSAGSNQARIYGEDVSGTTRLKVVDEGNVPFTIYQRTGTATFLTAGTIAVSLTTNETNDSYKVFVTGNVNETFWVTSKATTGFTINSSNASSTAVVDWVIMR